MRGGALRHQVTVQQVSEAQSTSGAVTRTWSTFATVRAEIRPIRGSEREVGNQLLADATHTVRMRYLSGLTPKMRILHDSRILEITSIANLFERNREYELTCQEVL